MKMLKHVTFYFIIFSLLCAITTLSESAPGGTCEVGDIIQLGGSCTYPGTDAVFSVDDAGNALFQSGFVFFRAAGNLNIRNSNINGRRYTLVTEHSAGGGRRITELGGGTAPADDDTTIDEPGDDDTTIDPGDDDTILIPDPNLAAAIRQEIGNSITRQTLLNLTGLYAPYREITDLTGLEHARNLTELSLWNNAISDISPLAHLTKLTWLNLGGNAISDISPVARLTNLTTLNLGGNTISDISPVAHLTNLTWLGLSINTISDVGTLERLMAQGTVVYFRGNPAFEMPGPKIEDGWVWLVVPATDVDSVVDAARSGRDFLSEASGGAVTEADVAINGARAGTRVGDSVWTSAALPATDVYNLNAIVRDYNLGTDIDAVVVYGVVPIHSKTVQKTRVYIGGTNLVKVWLNGTLIYKDIGHSRYSLSDYVTALPVQLNAGANQQHHTPFEGLTISDDGTVRLIVGNSQITGFPNFCIGIGSINGVRLDIHDFFWAHRADSDSDYVPIEDTRSDSRICGYKVLTDPGQYRVFLDFSMNGNRHDAVSQNSIEIK